MGYSLVANQWILNLFKTLARHSPDIENCDLFNEDEPSSTSICGGKFSDVQISTKNLGGAIKINGKCEKCHERVAYISSPILKIQGKSRVEIGCKMAVASLVAGSTPTETLRFLDLAGIEHYSQSTVSEINQELREPIEEECSFILDTELKTVIDKYGLMLDLTLDFTWNARNKGKLGTLVAISSKSKKVLFRVHRLRIGKKKNHDESNKAMEGRAVEDLVKIIDEKKLQVGSVPRQRWWDHENFQPIFWPGQTRPSCSEYSRCWSLFKKCEEEVR